MIMLPHNRRYLPGPELKPSAQLQAFAMFPQRHTKTSPAPWAERKDGTFLPFHFATDQEWLECTKFPVDEAGNIREGDEIYPIPTWPDDPELRKSWQDEKKAAKAAEHHDAAIADML